MDLLAERQRVLEGTSAALDVPAALADVTDAWMLELFDREVPVQAGVALVAVGGYGRRELCPGSDLDLMLLHSERDDAAELADRLWYPIWDLGLKVGHSVRTISECLSGVRTDNDTATSLLSARLVAGDAALVHELSTAVGELWRSDRGL